MARIRARHQVGASRPALPASREPRMGAAAVTPH